MYTYTSASVLFYIIASLVLPEASSNISLSIPQLNDWKWADASTKIYNYKISGNITTLTTLECVLSNPAQQNVMTYKLSFYLDKRLQRGSKVNISGSHRSESIKHTIKLNKNNKNVTCTAGVIIENVTKEVLRNEIILNHVSLISPPSLSIIGPPKLQEAEYTAHNFTQSYIYNFTDGEYLTLDCALTYPEGSEVYDLTFNMGEDNKEVQVEGPKTPRNIQTFVLKKENTIIKCLAKNRGINLPKYLMNIVHLQYSPWLTGTSSGWIMWSLGVLAVLVICSAVCCGVFVYRQKKKNIEPNYANLTKDRNYLTMPTPDPKLLPPFDTGHMPKMVAENHYCEIQDPSDTNEPPYAVPYDQSSYSKPYVPRSDGPYAEPYVPKSSCHTTQEKL